LVIVPVSYCRVATRAASLALRGAILGTAFPRCKGGIVDSMNIVAWYFLAGCAAGFCGGLLGIGGGLIVVPVLLMLFAAQSIAEPLVMPLALGTSLASIVFTSLSSIRAHHARQSVNWPLVRQMAPGLVLGAVIGGILSAHFSSIVLKVFFLAFAVIAATQMLLARPSSPSQQPHRQKLPGATPLFAAGGAIAGIASLTGCGGASLAVPFMNRYAVPMRNAIGSASAFSLPVALAGSTVYIILGWDKAGLPPLSLGFVHLPALIAISVGSTLAVPLGATLSHRLPVAALKKFFAFMMYAVAGKMLVAVL
jgi:uncharacterized protein